MIARPLDAISEADITALVNDGVAEDRTLEYKEALPGSSDADKKEFLADVSSFANTAGGDLIFGVSETAGLPTQILGITATDLDLEVRRLDSILASGLSPRIRYFTKTLSTWSGQRLLVVRVERSWVGPHRVVYKGHDKFYGRSSAGKYPLDVTELRAAFSLSATAIERIRAFRVDRIIALANNQTPMPFKDDPKVVIHCIPIEAFAGNVQHDIRGLNANSSALSPMGTTKWNRRLNLRGTSRLRYTQPLFYLYSTLSHWNYRSCSRSYPDARVRWEADYCR